MNRNAFPLRSALRLVPFLVLVVVTFAGFSCSVDSGNGNGTGVTGSGPVKSETRPLEAFTSVQMDGSFDTEWAPGDAFSATVEAQENLLPHLKTEVQGGRLKIYSDVSFGSTEPIKIKLTGKQLDLAALTGSGDLTATGISGPKFDAVISGSGDLTLAGEAPEATFVLSGSGTINAGDLKTTTAGVQVSGSGDASVNVSDKLTAIVAGSGSVTYQGNPKNVVKKITGSGDVEAK